MSDIDGIAKQIKELRQAYANGVISFSEYNNELRAMQREANNAKFKVAMRDATGSDKPEWLIAEESALQDQFDNGQIDVDQFHHELASLRNDAKREQDKQDLRDAGRGHLIKD